MLSMEFIKSGEKTYQQQIKDLEEQVKFFKNKSQRVEKANKKLKDNWNELKKWLEEQNIFNYLAPVDIKNKMQELEQEKEWKD